MLSEAELAPLVQDFYASVLAREDEMRLLELVQAGEDARSAQAQHWAQVAEQARKDLGSNNLGSTSFISAGFIKKHGLALKLDDVELRQVNQAMLRASCDLAEALHARFMGDFNFEPADKLLKLVLSKHAETAGHSDANPNAPSVAPFERVDGEQSGPPFVEVAEKFRASQLETGHWERQTALQARKSYELFADHCGNRPLVGYVRADAVAFRDMLVLLPAQYGKAAEFRDMRTAEIIAATAGKPLDRLSPRTVQRHLAALSALWEQALEAGELNENLFSNLKLPKAKKSARTTEHVDVRQARIAVRHADLARMPIGNSTFEGWQLRYPRR